MNPDTDSFSEYRPGMDDSLFRVWELAILEIGSVKWEQIYRWAVLGSDDCNPFWAFTPYSWPVQPSNTLSDTDNLSLANNQRQWWYKIVDGKKDFYAEKIKEMLRFVRNHLQDRVNYARKAGIYPLPETNEMVDYWWSSVSEYTIDELLFGSIRLRFSEVDLRKPRRVDRDELDQLLLKWQEEQRQKTTDLFIQSQDVNSVQKSDRKFKPESILSNRQTALKLAIEGIVATRENNGNDIYTLYCTLTRRSDRIGYSAESWNKAKYLLRDYFKVLPLLSDGKRKEAKEEMKVIASGHGKDIDNEDLIEKLKNL